MRWLAAVAVAVLAILPAFPSLLNPYAVSILTLIFRMVGWEREIRAQPVKLGEHATADQGIRESFQSHPLNE